MRKQIVNVKAYNKEKQAPFAKLKLITIPPNIKNLLQSEYVKSKYDMRDMPDTTQYKTVDFTSDDELIEFKHLFDHIHGCKASTYTLYITNKLGKLHKLNLDFYPQHNRANIYILQRYYFAINGPALIQCETGKWNINENEYLQFPYLFSLTNNHNLIPFTDIENDVRRNLQKDTQILCFTGAVIISANTFNRALPNKLSTNKLVERNGKFNEDNEQYLEDIENETKHRQYLTAEEKRNKIVDSFNKQQTIKDKINENPNISDDEKRKLIIEHLKTLVL